MFKLAPSCVLIIINRPRPFLWWNEVSHVACPLRVPARAAVAAGAARRAGGRRRPDVPAQEAVRVDRPVARRARPGPAADVAARPGRLRLPGGGAVADAHAR